MTGVEFQTQREKKLYKGANFDCFSSLKKKKKREGEMITSLNVS